MVKQYSGNYTIIVLLHSLSFRTDTIDIKLTGNFSGTKGKSFKIVFGKKKYIGV